MQFQSRCLKWQILLKVLPWAVLFCGVKLGMHYWGWEPWAFDSLTGALFGAATFVVALVLNGTLSDYRTSELIPLQMVNALETIQDTNLMIAAAHPGYDPQPLRTQLTQVSRATCDWLTSDKDLSTVQEAIAQLNPLLVPISQLGGAPIVSRLQAEQAKLRLLVAQMQVHRDTTFLGPAYVLLWLFILSSSLALLLVSTERFSENLAVSTFIFTALIYLLVLICDLDNPFEYDGKSSVDVDLSPLKDVGDRLAQTHTSQP